MTNNNRKTVLSSIVSIIVFYVFYVVVKYCLFGSINLIEALGAAILFTALFYLLNQLLKNLKANK